MHHLQQEKENRSQVVYGAISNVQPRYFTLNFRQRKIEIGIILQHGRVQPKNSCLAAGKSNSVIDKIPDLHQRKLLLGARWKATCQEQWRPYR